MVAQAPIDTIYKEANITEFPNNSNTNANTAEKAEWRIRKLKNTISIMDTSTF